MTRTVALLRGVNVGGRNKLPMADLRVAMTTAGFEGAATYLQSGNIIFDVAPPGCDDVAAALQGLIQDRFEVSSPVVLRQGTEIASVATNNPFLADEDDPARLHVTFLDAAPGMDCLERLDPDRSPGDRFCVRDREIYLHLPNGAARTKLTVDYFERTLDVTATNRNWNTVHKLLELSGG